MKAIFFTLPLLLGLSACEQQPAQPIAQGGSSTKIDRMLPIADYKTARGVLWRSLYRNGGQTLYCRLPFDSNYRKGINVEHVFPMSWVTRSLKCGTRNQCRARSDIFNRIEANLHNLYPSRTEVNADRGSFRFGEIAGEARRYGPDCDFEVSERARTVEPAPAVRGEIARSMFYMAYKYKQQGLVIFARQARMLHAWHLADPPDTVERLRNQHIEALQGNRNPFIDDPQELDELVASGFFF